MKNGEGANVEGSVCGQDNNNPDVSHTEEARKKRKTKKKRKAEDFEIIDNVKEKKVKKRKAEDFEIIDNVKEKKVKKRKAEDFEIIDNVKEKKVKKRKAEDCEIIDNVKEKKVKTRKRKNADDDNNCHTSDVVSRGQKRKKNTEGQSENPDHSFQDSDDISERTSVSKEKKDKKSKHCISEHKASSVEDLSSAHTKKKADVTCERNIMSHKEKKSKKKTVEAEHSDIPKLMSIDCKRITENEPKEKMINREKLDKSSGQVDETKNRNLFSPTRIKKMKQKERVSVKKLLEQRTNVGSNLQVLRIKSVCQEVSYDELMDELVRKLKKKMAKRDDLQREGKDRKIEKLDGKIEKLKNEAYVKAAELKSNADEKLAQIETAIMKKMKKKRRKKRLVVQGMAQERFAKGKTSYGSKCQNGLNTLQKNSMEARSEVKQAMKETRAELKSELREFKRRIKRLDLNTPGNDIDPAFSGAVLVKGYLY